MIEHMDTGIYAENIYRIVNDRGIKQSWLAKQVGISKSHLCGMLRGKYPMKKEYVERVAIALRCTVDDLLKQD